MLYSTSESVSLKLNQQPNERNAAHIRLQSLQLESALEHLRISDDNLTISANAEKDK